MELSKAGTAEIIGHEGIVPFKYLDSVGVPTWMIGHTDLAGIPPKVRDMQYGVEYPLADGIRAFRADMRRFVKRVNDNVKVAISQTMFDALVSFDFNTGRVHNATLTKKLNAGDKAGATTEFDKWKIPPEIVGRRMKEKKLFSSGEYSNGMKAALIPANSAGKPLYGQGKTVDLTPVVNGIFDANAVDAQADSDRNKAAGAATGGAAAGGGTAAPVTPEIDPATWDIGLIVIAVVLLAAAAYFGYRWIAGRRKAKALDKQTATLIEDAPPVVERKARVRTPKK